MIKTIIKAIIHKPLEVLESIALNKTADEGFLFPPVFILGAPRSGSTLLYQCLTESLDFSYPTNLHHYLYTYPGLAEPWVKTFASNKKKSGFSSDLGRIKGVFSPSEFGEFWYRFFPRTPHYLTQEDVDQKKVLKMRQSLIAWQRASKKPLLIKNLNMGLRLDVLHAVIPEALYIVIKRDLADNAISLLNARQKLHGDFETWWSMEPANIDTIKKLPVANQVITQVRDIEAFIEERRQRIGTHKFTDVTYDALCSAPHETISEIRDFLSANHITVQKKHMDDMPKSFGVRQKGLTDKVLEENVRTQAQE